MGFGEFLRLWERVGLWRLVCFGGDEGWLCGKDSRVNWRLPAVIMCLFIISSIYRQQLPEIIYLKLWLLSLISLTSSPQSSHIFIVEVPHFAEPNLNLSSCNLPAPRDLVFLEPKYFPDSYNASTNTIPKIDAPIHLASFQSFTPIFLPRSPLPLLFQAAT